MVLKGYQVVSIKDTHSCFISKYNILYEYNLETELITEIFKFPINFTTLISKANKILRRLLRTDIRYGVKIDQEHLLLAYNNKLHKLDYVNGKVVCSLQLPRGSRPLNITIIESLEGFRNGIYFGEYFDNPFMDSVNVFRYENNQLETVHSFGSGLINHIHNLVPDFYRNCIWILAGDFDGAAAIFKATDDFRVVEKIVSGKQIYRSCVAFPLKNGLLYATDTQFETNSIRLLNYEQKCWKSKFISELNGSCIFGTSLKGKYYFSTAVEAINSGNIIAKYLRNKRGPGIKLNQSEIICVDSELECNKIYTNKKDWLPFILFQFGNIIFPSGINDSDYLVYTPIALKMNDFSTEIIKVNNEI